MLNNLITGELDDWFRILLARAPTDTEEALEQQMSQ